MSPAVAQDTTLIVHPRVFYYEGTQNTGAENEAWTLGGWIGYRSPWLRNTFALAATVYGSVPLHAPAEKDGTFLLESGQEGYVVLGEAFGTMRFRPLALKAGRQVVDQGYINPSDIRMTPFTFEGVTLGGGSDDDLRFLAGYLWKMKEWNVDRFISMARRAGATESNAGVALAGVEVAVLPHLRLEVSEQYGFDTFNTLYAKGSYQHTLNADWAVGIGAEYTDQRAVGAALVTTSATSEWRTYVGASRLQLFFKDLTLSAAFSNTGSGSAIQNPWGTYPGFLSLIDAPASQGFARTNEKGWLVGAVYDASPRLLVVINVAAGSGALDAKMPEGLPNQVEYDVRIESRWSSAPGSPRFTVRGALYDREYSVRLGRQIHLIFDWGWHMPARDGRQPRQSHAHVGRLEDSAIRVVPTETPDRGDMDDVRIGRVNAAWPISPTSRSPTKGRDSVTRGTPMSKERGAGRAPLALYAPVGSARRQPAGCVG